jgi:hypothetical protein
MRSQVALPVEVIRDAFLVGLVPQLLLVAAGHYIAFVTRGLGVGIVVVALLVSLLAGAWASPTSPLNAVIVGLLAGGGGAIVASATAFLLGDVRPGTATFVLVGAMIGGAIGGAVGRAAARGAFGG